MADWLLRALAPRNAMGFILRLVILIGVVTLANFAFSKAFSGHDHAPSYYIGHALFVGGPLIAFFLAITVWQVNLQRRLWILSRQDALTGLHNRRSFFEQVERTRAEDGRGILMLIDADHFKAVNDAYGHQTGDRCLIQIAETLQRNVRKDDIVGRIGGEEFAVFLRATSRSEAEVIGDRLTTPIRFRRIDDEVVLTVTLSIGAALAKPGQPTDDVFARADTALYDAKLEGRARIIFALPDMAA